MTLQTAEGHGGTPLNYSAKREENPLRAGGDILACGFGMTVAAWIAAYITRMPLWGSPRPGR